MTDRRGVGEPETIVELPSGHKLLGLFVWTAEHGACMLGIRLNPAGEPVRCAWTNTVSLHIEPMQRNPMRRVDIERKGRSDG